MRNAGGTSIAGRYNGGEETAITPTNNAPYTNGLALFTRRNTMFELGLAGRFYGGVWINRGLTTTERANLERWQTIRTLAA